MEIKIKVLYRDRVKPTDLMQFGEHDTKSEIREKAVQMLGEVMEQILDDNNPVTGIYISRE